MKHTQTESRIEEIKIQQLVDYTNVDNMIKEDSILPLAQPMAAAKLKAMHSTVH